MPRFLDRFSLRQGIAAGIVNIIVLVALWGLTIQSRFIPISVALVVSIITILFSIFINMESLVISKRTFNEAIELRIFSRFTIGWLIPVNVLLALVTAFTVVALFGMIFGVWKA